MRQATDESSPETIGEAAPALSVGACSLLPSDDASADAAGLFSQCDQHAAEVECEPTQTGPNAVLELERKIALLETQLADCQEKPSEAEKKMRSYWDVNFP